MGIINNLTHFIWHTQIFLYGALLFFIISENSQIAMGVKCQSLSTQFLSRITDLYEEKNTIMGPSCPSFHDLNYQFKKMIELIRFRNGMRRRL